MPEIVSKPRTKTKPQTERPKLYKVILVNDDFTPRWWAVIITRRAWSSLSLNSPFRTVTTNSRGVKSSLTRMTL